MRKLSCFILIAIALPLIAVSQEKTKSSQVFTFDINGARVGDTTLDLNQMKINVKDGVLEITVPDSTTEYKGYSRIEESISITDEVIDNIGKLSDIAGNKRKSRFETSWAGLEFAYLNYADFAGDYNSDYRLSGGWRFSWNIVDIEIPFSKTCGLLTGIGYQSDVMFASKANKFISRMFVDQATGNVDYTAFEDAQKAKLVARYITLPLMFECQNNDGSFKFDIGAIVGWNFYTRLKAEFVEENVNSETKFKDADTFMMNDFKAEGTIRFAYKSWQLFFNMSLTPMFDTDIHDRIYPYTVGVNLLF